MTFRHLPGPSHGNFRSQPRFHPLAPQILARQRRAAAASLSSPVVIRAWYRTFRSH
jgi:hypothetical protein